MILEYSRMEAKCLFQCTVQEWTVVVHCINGVMLHALDFTTDLFLYLGMTGKLIKHPLNGLSATEAGNHDGVEDEPLQLQIQFHIQQR